MRRHTGIPCLIALGIAMGIVDLANAQPNLGDLNGRVQTGQVLQIDGSSFGPGSTILTWDDFDSGDSGTTVDGKSPVYGFKWDVANNVPGENHDIQYATDRAWSGNQSARVWWYQASLLYMGWVGKGPYPEVYWSYRRYHDPRGPGDSDYTALPTNHKQSYLYGTQSGGYPHFMVGAIMEASKNPWLTAWQGPNGSDDNELDNRLSPNLTYEASSFRWQRWELYVKYNTLGNTNGEQSCLVIDDQTGNQYSTYLDNVSFTTSANGGGRDWRIGYMYQGYGGPEIARSFYDDIWVATNRSRVEIGNNSVFLNCTKRDIQPHTSWASGSISVDIQTPSFKTGDAAYLFVIDSDGRPSQPRDIIIGANYSGVVDSEDPTVTVNDTQLPIKDFATSPPHFAVITGTTTDNNGVASVTWENSLGGSGSANGSSNWQIENLELFVGNNEITIRVTDFGGNFSETQVSIEWDFPGEPGQATLKN